MAGPYKVALTPAALRDLRALANRPPDRGVLASSIRFIDAGTAPIPVPFKSKVPVLKQWPTLRLTRDTVTEHFNGEPTNVGLLWGVASAGLVDGDLDCPEAVSLAARFLPATPCLFGRESTGAAHWLWRLSCAVPTTKFEDVEKEATDGKDAPPRIVSECRRAAMGCVVRWREVVRIAPSPRSDCPLDADGQTNADCGHG